MIRAALSAGNESISAQYVDRLNTVIAHSAKKKCMKICSSRERAVLDRVNEVSEGRLLTAVLCIKDSVRKQCFLDIIGPSLVRYRLQNVYSYCFVYALLSLSDFWELACQY